MPEGNTIKELEVLFETPFEEALMMANQHQNFDDLINFLEGGIGTQFTTGNVEGMSDAELRRITIELCQRYRRNDVFHPATGRLILKECEKRGMELPPNVLDWLHYLTAWRHVLKGNRLFDEQMSLRRQLKSSTENSHAEEEAFERLLKTLPQSRLEDLIHTLAGQEINWTMANMLLFEVDDRGGCPEGCEEALKRIEDDAAAASTAATLGMAQLQC